tara:strand:- start:8918 stop:10102 length:1185 start_codon:yes stop_codon:yes gene_type:complete
MIPPSVLPTLDALMPWIDKARLSGEEGGNRCRDRACQIQAVNDYQAIQVWLREYQQSADTHRTYRREAERLLLWCVFQQQKALSSLQREDFDAYFTFLTDPQPTALWCTQGKVRNVKRGAATWRPFVNGLTVSSLGVSKAAISSLFNYLVSANYLAFNPLVLMKGRHRTATTATATALLHQETVLEPKLWDHFIHTLHTMPDGSPHERDEKCRMTLLVYCLFYLGLRPIELARQPMNNFYQVKGEWWYRVVGKGDKAATLPVPDTLMRALKQARLQWGLTAEPNNDDVSPIIPSWHSKEGLNRRSLHRLLKELAQQAAETWDTSPEEQEVFHRVSAKWLRRGLATRLTAMNVDKRLVQNTLRHDSYDMTLRYIAKDRTQWRNTINDLPLTEVGG